MCSEISAVYVSNDEHNDDCLKFTNKIKSAFYNIAREFVYIGFLLAECDYFETYKEWGYSSIHEYASDRLGLKKSSTYNFINVCKAFTEPTECMPCSYFMKDKYENFNYSQLVEMLSMSDKQRSQVTPDMTVKQIRQVKKSSDEPDYITLFNQQFKFEEFRYEFIKKIDNKKFRLLIKGLKVDVSDSWPDGYMLSIDTDFGDSGSGCGYQPFVDYEKFKELIISKIPVSRRLEDTPEEASAPEVTVEPEPEVVSYPGYDLLIPLSSDLHALFNSIEEAYLDIDKNIDSDLFDIVFDYLKSNDYIICKKVNKKLKNRFALK